jgi:presenilin-like A22 family membrane protease
MTTRGSFRAGSVVGWLASVTAGDAIDPKRTRQMIRLADGVVFDYVVPIFNMVTSTAKDSNGA